MARPKAEIDESAVAEMAYEGASDREIADVLGVSHQTIGRRFGPILRKNRAQRRYDLRRAQTLAAKEGNAALLIWLGKQELDQTDKADARHVGTIRVEYVRDDTLARAAPEPGEGEG